MTNLLQFPAILFFRTKQKSGCKRKVFNRGEKKSPDKHTGELHDPPAVRPVGGMEDAA
jgi:hypothetical protein